MATMVVLTRRGLVTQQPLGLSMGRCTRPHHPDCLQLALASEGEKKLTGGGGMNIPFFLPGCAL